MAVLTHLWRGQSKPESGRRQERHCRLIIRAKPLDVWQGHWLTSTRRLLRANDPPCARSGDYNTVCRSGITRTVPGGDDASPGLTSVLCAPVLAVENAA